MVASIFRHQASRTTVRIILLLVTSMLAYLALILPLLLEPVLEPLKPGDVAASDYLAPRSLSFESNVLAQIKKDEARQRVAPVYLPIDPNISRRQIERLRVSLNFISSVRFDPYSTAEQKINDLSSLQDIQITPSFGESLLSLSENRWQTIQQESLSTLEEIMKKTIREDQVEDAQENVPTMISFALPEDQSIIVTNLITPFVIANSLYSEELTEAARSEAVKSITSVSVNYVVGEIIVRRGQIITPQAYEALEKFELTTPEKNEKDFIGSLALVIVIAALMALYFSRRKSAPIEDFRAMLVVCITFLIFLFSARLFLPNRAVIPYLFPLAAFALTIASIYSLEVSLIFSIALGILAPYGFTRQYDLSLYFTLSSIVGVMLLYKGRRLGQFFTAGLSVGLIGAVVVIAYRLPDSYTDLLGVATLTGASLINGFASASLSLLVQYIFSQTLGVTTALQLLDLSRPDHPLLQFILRNAPGTYQHSLQVANLAEQAAEAIGADAILTRVGALYHDAGKAMNPAFFIENQITGKLNPHDDILPSEASATIIRHVTDGVALGKKYRLPRRVIDFMREHHGTLLTRYQYSKALEAAREHPERVDANLFRYPGPRPQSRETALLMLADGCEARARAEFPQDEKEFLVLIKKVIDYYTREEQLNDTRLTLRDLNLITDSFMNTMRNTYHPRIKYPEAPKIQSEADLPATTGHT